AAIDPVGDRLDDFRDEVPEPAHRAPPRGNSESIDRQAQKEERAAYLADAEVMPAGRKRAEVRLQNGARERQVAERVVVDQAFDRRAGSAGIALQLGDARVIACDRSVEVAVDSSGASLRRAPGGIAGVREPRAAVGDAFLHVGDAVEVIAIPEIQPARAAALAADAEIGDPRAFVPAGCALRLRDARDDVLVAG